MPRLAPRTRAGADFAALAAGFAGSVRPPPAREARMPDDRRRQYWVRNLTYVGVLLAIWFTVSYGFGILWVERLDAIRIGGFRLGFWFAQQGSIYMFVILIFVYVRLMNRLDRRFEFDESEEAG
jgi:putative solute:sodium symporter small subunit